MFVVVPFLDFVSLLGFGYWCLLIGFVVYFVVIVFVASLSADCWFGGLQVWCGGLDLLVLTLGV